MPQDDEAVGDAVGQPVQFPEGQGAAFPGEDDGRGVGLAAGHLRKVGGNVDEVGSVHVLSFCSLPSVRARKPAISGITSSFMSSRM